MLYIFLHIIPKIIQISGIRVVCSLSSSVHALTRSAHRELGIELVSLKENHSHTPKRPSMVEEKRDDGTRDPFKLFLKESLA
jgi:hypothetical protein